MKQVLELCIQSVIHPCFLFVKHCSHESWNWRGANKLFIGLLQCHDHEGPYSQGQLLYRVVSLL